MAVCEILQSKTPSTPVRPVSEESEYAKNVIFEFLYASGFHSSASVFYAESEMHQIPRTELIEQLKVDNSPGLLAELLLSRESHPSISTQTENVDLFSRLEAVEQEVKRKKQMARYESTEDILRRGIEKLELEFEERFNRELGHRLDIFRASDLSMIQSEETRRHNAEIIRMRRDMELELGQKSAELRAQFQRDSDIFRSKQRELEREIGKWADVAIKHVSIDGEAIAANQIKEEAERKAAKIKGKALALNQKCERGRRKLEDLRLEHNRAKREIEKLRMAIAMYQRNPD
jgi:hypothetical protein